MLTDWAAPTCSASRPATMRSGIVAGDYLADHWADKKIAILHDDTTFGKGVAELTKEQLNGRGLTEAIYRGLHPRRGGLLGAESPSSRRPLSSWSFVGGYHTEIALMVIARRATAATGSG